MLKTLEGVRVIDFGMAAAGPSATKILSEFGAEVIVVEPLQGTSTRWMTNTYDYWRRVFRWMQNLKKAEKFYSDWLQVPMYLQVISERKHCRNWD